MKYVIWIFSLCGAVFALGCKNVMPMSSELASYFEAPKINGLMSNVYSISLYSDSVTITGTCDVTTQALQIRIGSIGAWATPFTIGTPDLDCADGAYSFTISGDLGLSGASLPGDFFDMYMRAESFTGQLSATSVARIRLATGLKNNFAGISAGGGAMAGVNYKIKGVAVSAKSQNVMIGSTYKVRVK